jgi:hypothetical protein
VDGEPRIAAKAVRGQTEANMRVRFPGDADVPDHLVQSGMPEVAALH